jgi:hypothetical protein
MADLNKSTKIIQDSTKAFVEALQRLDSRVFDAFAKDSLSKLETGRNGQILNNAKNTKIIAGMVEAMRKAFRLSGVYGQLDDFVANFDSLANQTQAVQKFVNSLSIPSSLISPVKKLYTDQVLFDMQGAGLATNLVRPLQQQLFKSILSGTNILDVQRELEQQFVGDANTTGLLKRYGTQISRDALGQFEGTLNQSIKNEYKLNAIRYVGSLVDDSREQCKRWVRARIILDSELQDEIRWAENEGSGMIAGTTPANFLQNRGGYNCRHVAIPVQA